ncbi:hypothetical protein C4578_00965 [Candidatus Microgenomates bacterium]|jgi:hypothetical protein|nr:MAG: hypothetical protein C4578_00965 [Candidatus Microgenomates bacterium]
MKVALVIFLFLSFFIVFLLSFDFLFSDRFFEEIFTFKEEIYSWQDQGGIEDLDEKGWKAFLSKDNSFKFSYPPEWKVVEVSPKAQSSFRVPVESWALANFDYQEQKSAFILPADAVVINFNIVTEGIKQSLKNHLDCEGSFEKCENVVINGVVFKKTLTKGNESQGINLTTIKNGKIYEISGIITSSESESFFQVEEILNTIEIIQSI